MGGLIFEVASLAAPGRGARLPKPLVYPRMATTASRGWLITSNLVSPAVPRLLRRRQEGNYGAHQTSVGPSRNGPLASLSAFSHRLIARSAAYPTIASGAHLIVGAAFGLASSVLGRSKRLQYVSGDDKTILGRGATRL
jgi:hypothetical protein